MLLNRSPFWNLLSLGCRSHFNRASPVHRRRHRRRRRRCLAHLLIVLSQTLGTVTFLAKTSHHPSNHSQADISALFEEEKTGPGRAKCYKHHGSVIKLILGFDCFLVRDIFLRKKLTKFHYHKNSLKICTPCIFSESIFLIFYLSLDLTI